MRKAALKLVLTYVVYLLAAMVQKPLFMLAHASMSPTALSVTDWLSVIWHGLPMDCCVAAYFTAVPLLLIFAELMGLPQRAAKIAESVWYTASAVIIAFVFVLDMGLYSAWGFRLDVSPLFYFTTSPAAAMASVTLGQAVAAFVAFAVYGGLITLAFRFWCMRISVAPIGTGQWRRKLPAVGGLVLSAALLFVAIRGGVTVSTMNLSRSYFSRNTFLNHAALNPAFTLLYSAMHQQDFGTQFRYLPDDEADAIFEATHKPQLTPRAAVDSLLAVPTPDVYIIILESFSAELFPHLGGEAVATRLDSVARDGITFTNFYANGFRTDRGVPAILSGFPGVPTASILKFVDKTAAMPGIAESLRRHGWQTSYYYGGDINFTNLYAYLINTGFDKVVCDKDFPLVERTGKWGAHDHLVFNRSLADAAATAADAAPQLRVIQTSSSHEPFEVPASILPNERANAFAYTDSCTAAFINALGSSGRPWVAVLVADHYGAYPEGLTDPMRRHHIPLIITGPALRRHGLAIDTTASQTDIAATLLSMLGIPAAEFTFSTDILDPDAPHLAFFYDPGLMALAAQNGKVIYNIDSDSYVNTSESAIPTDTLMLPAAKAYLQTIYNHFHHFPSLHD